MNQVVILCFMSSFILIPSLYAQQITIDPCYSNPCAPSAICTSYLNSLNYTCSCPPGFLGNGFINCTDVCNPNPCSDKYATCHVNPNYNNYSSQSPYLCTCEAPNTIGTNGTCCHQFCSSTAAASHASLYPIHSKAKQSSLPKNDTPTCESHCTFAAYVCQSGNVNYQNPPKCLPFNICEPYNPCGYGTCTPTGPNNSSFNCECDQGFYKNENGKCEDIDECLNASTCSDLSNGTICKNTIGGYTCSCDLTNSLAVLGDNGTVICLALNNCSTTGGSCQQNCESLLSGTECTCVEGYQMVNGACEFDEKSSNAKCDKSCSQSSSNHSGVCLNNECVCFTGYELKNGICVPEYSCASINHDCYFGFNCTNTPTRPGFTCNCSDQFVTGPDGRCYDYDECAGGNNDCDGNATCVNLNGGYFCKCNSGFIGNGTKCEEIPNICETALMLDSCSVAGESCRLKAPGIPECYCAIPYSLIGDEEHGFVCIPPDSSIYIYQLSLELIGNYEDESYIAKRELEFALLKDFFPYITNASVLNLEVTTYDPQPIGVQVTMKILFSQDVSYLADLLRSICSPYSFYEDACILPQNLLTYESSISYHDITNYVICQNSEFLCGEDAVCQVLDHDYKCECVSSYVPNGYINTRKPTCMDRDECMEKPGICGSPTQMCINTPGNYSCECIPCFIWDESHSDCMFICQNNPCQNNGYCQPMMTADICSYGCTCSENFFGPNCELSNDALHVAKNNEAIIGGVLGGLLIIMVGLAIFLVYKIQSKKGELKV